MVGLEGHYARIVRSLSDDGVLANEDKDFLMLFICIQMRRTEHAIKNMRDFSNLMADMAFRNRPEQRPTDPRSDEDLIRSSMEIGLKMHDYARDLKVAIFKNRTHVDFVICDHPAVITNRFNFQRLNDDRFGISNSGAILAMPLTPRLCAVGYDGGVYTVPNASGTPFVLLNNERDVRAINELQYLNAGKNIYFSRWEDNEDVAEQARKTSEERGKVKPSATIFISDPETPGRFRRGTAAEEAASRHEVIASSFGHPKPSSWPSQIKIKDKPKAYSNGSLMGWVRKREWLYRRQWDNWRR